MVRVFLVDDHEIVRRGLADLIEFEPDLEVVGEADSVAEALVRIPRTPVDVAVLDVRLGDGNGVELCRELRSTMPELNCLMLTSYADDEALFDAIMAGASGFVLNGCWASTWSTRCARSVPAAHCSTRAPPPR